MNAALFSSRGDRLAGRLDVLGNTTGQPGNRRPLDLLGNGVHRGKIALADHRKTALDHVHLKSGQLTGDLEFFAQRHGGAGALFAVAECRVKNDDPILFHFFVDEGCLTKNPVAFLGSGVYELSDQ